MHHIYPIANSPITSRMEIPGSKSITNRALLLAALANGKSLLKGVSFCDDTLAMINALRQLGIYCDIDIKHQQVLVSGCSGNIPKRSATIECHDAGTVLRFLLAICAFTQGRYTFSASLQLMQRPIAPMLELLKNQGVNFTFLKEQNQLPLIVEGVNRLRETTLIIPGEQSSQFLTGVLIAAPLLKSKIILRTENLVSIPYVNMTCQMMENFGVKVNSAQELYVISTPSSYQACDYFIEPDLSTASYFYAAAALTQGTIKIHGIQRHNIMQGDIAIIDILEKMGCTIKDEPDGIKLIGTDTLTGIDINMKDYSDLFITIACLAAFASSLTIIRGINHIRNKESNRIYAVKSNLNKVGINLQEYQDHVAIIPGQPLPAELESFADHRIVMGFAIMGLKTPKLKMRNAECVNKTCPSFFELWEKMLMQPGK